MPAGIGRLLADWLSLEPSASPLIFFTAAVLFGVTVTRPRDDRGKILLQVDRAAIALAVMLIFVGVVGAFYFLLSRSYETFESSAELLARGEEFQKELDEARKTWGGDITQNDLSVTHTSSHTEVKQFQGPDSQDLYINKVVVENIDQESVVSFKGIVSIHLIDARTGTYAMDASYLYEIVNQSDLETTASFQFLIGKLRTSRDLLVTIDGRDVGSQKVIDEGIVSWDWTMKPRQQSTVMISYKTQGMGAYSYRVSSKQIVRDFSLTVHVDSRDIVTRTRPDTTAIRVSSMTTDSGYQIDWSAENSIFSPDVGIRFKPSVLPDPDQQYMIDILRNAPRALMWTAVMVAFTMFICGLFLDLWKFTLFAAAFSAASLALMGLDLIKINHVALPPFLALCALVLVFLIYRALPRLPKVLVIVSTAIFLMGYPYSGLLSDGADRNAVDAIVQAVMILYIFGLSLYVRVRRSNV